MTRIVRLFSIALIVLAGGTAGFHIAGSHLAQSGAYHAADTSWTDPPPPHAL